MVQRYHQHCPEILKPHTKYSSRRELSFDVLDSSFVLATAGGDSVGRGETLTHVHASELAFWPNLRPPRFSMVLCKPFRTPKELLCLSKAPPTV